MIFLVLAFAGLISMIIKIKYRKTLFYLIKVNTFVLLMVLLLISSFSWDSYIVSFNLKKPDKSTVDYDYLFSLSDEVLPQLEMYNEYLNKDIIIHDEWRGNYVVNGSNFLEERIFGSIKSYEEHSWLSWNYVDYQSCKLLKSNL
jgi:hypothetical protein